MDKKATKILIFSLTSCFLLLRIPLLSSLFFHVDDTYVAQGVFTTYPLVTNLISNISFYVSKILYTTVDINRFLLQVYITRFLSLGLSLIGFWIFLKTVQNLFKDNIYLVISGLIICFSQMHITYSVHSSPYGYSIISPCIIILFLFGYNKYKLKSINFIFLLAILLTTVYLDNFAIFYFPALLLTIFLFEYKYLKLSLKSSLKFLIVFLATTINNIFYFFSILKPILELHGGINYNRGNQNQFVLLKNSFWDVFNEPLKIILFYVKNTFILLENNIAFYRYANIIEDEVVKYFIAPFCIGAIILFMLQNIRDRLFLFIAIVFFTIFCFVYIERLSLSPTRHFLGLLPLFILFFCSKLKQITTKNRKLIIISISLVIVLTSFVSYPSFLKMKNNNLTYYFLQKKIKSESIDYIIDYEYSNFISYMFPSKNRESLIKKINNSHSGQFKILIASHRKPIEKTFVVQELLKNTHKSNLDIIKKDIFVSNEEVGRNPSATNGTNSRFVYVANFTYKR